MDSAELKGALEAIIYAADEPATLDQLVNATGAERDAVRAALDEMIAACAGEERGVEIRRVARGYRFSTKPQHHEAVRKFIKSLRPPVRLSMPALETLAVIAYKQPITLPEIQEIRGVNCSGVIGTLLEKHLVTTAGRKAVMGRPILYRTTKDFLVRFGLDDVDELPSLKEFEQLAREALGPEAEIELGAETPIEGVATDSVEAAVEAASKTAAEAAAERGSEVSAEKSSSTPVEDPIQVSTEVASEESGSAGSETAAESAEDPQAGSGSAE